MSGTLRDLSRRPLEMAASLLVQDLPQSPPQLKKRLDRQTDRQTVYLRPSRWCETTVRRVMPCT